MWWGYHIPTLSVRRARILLAEQAKARPSLRQVVGLLATVALSGHLGRAVSSASLLRRVFRDARLLPTMVGPPRKLTSLGPQASRSLFQVSVMPLYRSHVIFV